MLNQSIIPGAPIPVEAPVIPTADHRPSSATPDGMHLLETRSMHFAHSALPNSRAKASNLAKHYFEF